MLQVYLQRYPHAHAQWSKWPKFVSLHYWRAPQGCQGCQKIWTTKLKSTLVSWSAKIQPKIEETVKNRQNWKKVSKKACFLKVFQILFNLGWILVFNSPVVFSLVFQIFWHPWHPWGMSIVENSFLKDLFLIFLLKLKPDITCIELTYRATMAEFIKWYKLWVS